MFKKQKMAVGSRHDAAVRGYLGAAGLACAFALNAILDTQFSLRLGRLQLHVRASIVSVVYRCAAHPFSCLCCLSFSADVSVVLLLLSSLLLLLLKSSLLLLLPLQLLKNFNGFMLQWML